MRGPLSKGGGFRGFLYGVEVVLIDECLSRGPYGAADAKIDECSMLEASAGVCRKASQHHECRCAWCCLCRRSPGSSAISWLEPTFQERYDARLSIA